MHEYWEGPTVEALADDESGSVPKPAKGVQPMLKHNSGELCMYACAPYKCTQLNSSDVLMCMQGVGLQCVPLQYV